MKYYFLFLIVLTQFHFNFLYSHYDKDSIEIDKVIERIYYVGRLKGPVALLIKLNKNKLIYPSDVLSVKDKQILFQGSLFCNTHLKKTIEQFCLKKRFDVILNLWINLGHYKYLYDQTIVKEFAVLILTFFYATVEKKVPYFSISTESTLKLFSESHLETIPLEEVLDILDILVEELPQFLEEYEFHSEISWKTWLKKYWLICPIAIAAFSLRLYLMYKGVKEPSKVGERPLTDTAARVISEGGIPFDFK